MALQMGQEAEAISRVPLQGNSIELPGAPRGDFHWSMVRAAGFRRYFIRMRIGIDQGIYWTR